MLTPVLTFGKRFPVPVLPRSGPQAAYRPTWFVHEARGDLNAAKLYELLHYLNPARAERLPSRRLRTIYLALLDDLRERFPLDGWVSSREYVNELPDEELPFAAEGIPIAVMGVDVYEEQLPACLVIPFLLSRTAREEAADEVDAVWAGQDSLMAHRAWLLPYLRDDVLDHFGVPRLPRGREWLPPWGALDELVAYAHCQTGYRWLDYTTGMLEESAELPPLNLAEIRDLERDWRRAKPVLDRIRALARYIERGSAARRQRELERLVKVLLGDRLVLDSITRPRGTDV